MSAPLPFTMTPDAEKYVRAHLRSPAPGQELALITCTRQSETIDGREVVVFDGEHFIFGFYDVGQRPQAHHIDLFGHSISIVASTLEALRGRTLSLRHVVQRHGLFRRITRDVLVAA